MAVDQYYERRKKEAEQERRELESMNPTQRRAKQEFFNPGYGVMPAKPGCLGKTPSVDVKNMSTAEYKALVLSTVESLNIKAKALSKLGIDEDQVTEVPPVVFQGFAHTNNSLYKDRCSNLYEVTWLFFSADQIYIYSYLLDMLSDSKKERTEEYFYKDVTNFSSASDTQEKKERMARYKDVKQGCSTIKVEDGEEVKTYTLETSMFKIVVPGESFTCAMEADEEVERRIQGMKQKLREKKA